MLMDFFPYGLVGKQSVDEPLEMFVEAKTLSRGALFNLFFDVRKLSCLLRLKILLEKKKIVGRG